MNNFNKPFYYDMNQPSPGNKLRDFFISKNVLNKINVFTCDYLKINETYYYFNNNINNYFIFIEKNYKKFISSQYFLWKNCCEVWFLDKENLNNVYVIPYVMDNNDALNIKYFIENHLLLE